MGSDTTPDAVTTTSEPVRPPSVQDRIQTLTDVHHRLQTLRHVPTMLLRPPSTSSLADFAPPFDPTIDREFAVAFNSTPTHDFRALKDFLEVLCSDKVQDALGAARASEDADRTELGLTVRRENRKRKYVCTSESNQTRDCMLSQTTTVSGGLSTTLRTPTAAIFVTFCVCRGRSTTDGSCISGRVCARV